MKYFTVLKIAVIQLRFEKYCLSKITVCKVTRNKIRIPKIYIDKVTILKKEEKIQDKVLDISSNKLLDMDELKISHSKIAVFETINIQFS